ncbi:MAG: ThuA domain-containing protein, partial [Bacteroidales bacterium]|nr:ThuA domain-containing protein [Bacteroidales bacterium]
AYDTAAFEKMFSRNDNMDVDMMSQPKANKALAGGQFSRYEAVVFYDMWQDITEDQKEAFIDLTRKGVGLVFLHHSLVSYQQWEEFEKIVGGRYFEKSYVNDPDKASAYKHDIEMEVSVMDPGHPITRDMNDFTITDEGYSDISILPSVKALLKVDHPHCADKVAWTNEYNNSRVVYLLFGHDNKAFQDKNYRRLLFNAIEWSAQQSN